MRTSQTSLLSYASLPARYGIVAEAGDGLLTITIPRPRGQAWLGISGTIVILCLVGAAVAWWYQLPWFCAAVPVAVIGAEAVCTFIFQLVSRKRRLSGDDPLIIAVTRQTVEIRNVDVAAELPDSIFPRDHVYEVKFVEYSGNLVVRAYDCEMYDGRPHHDRRVVKWIAEMLSETLVSEIANARRVASPPAS
jgi:hypothetical protein